MAEVLKALASLGLNFAERGEEFTRKTLKDVRAEAQASTGRSLENPLPLYVEAVRQASLRLSSMTPSSLVLSRFFQKKAGFAQGAPSKAEGGELGIQSLAGVMAVLSLAGLPLALLCWTCVTLRRADNARLDRLKLAEHLKNALSENTTSSNDPYRLLSHEQRAELSQIIFSKIRYLNRAYGWANEDKNDVVGVKRARRLYNMGARYILEGKPLGDRPEYMGKKAWREFKIIVEQARQLELAQRGLPSTSAETGPKQITSGDGAGKEISSIERVKLEAERLRVDFYGHVKKIRQAMKNAELSPESVFRFVVESRNLSLEIKRRYDALILLEPAQQIYRGEIIALDEQMKDLFTDLISYCEERIALGDLTEQEQRPWKELRNGLKRYVGIPETDDFDDENPSGGAATGDVQIVQLAPLALPPGTDASFEAFTAWSFEQGAALLLRAAEARLVVEPVAEGALAPAFTVSVLGAKWTMTDHFEALETSGSVAVGMALIKNAEAQLTTTFLDPLSPGVSPFEGTIFGLKIHWAPAPAATGFRPRLVVP